MSVAAGMREAEQKDKEVDRHGFFISKVSVCPARDVSCRGGGMVCGQL